MGTEAAAGKNPVSRVGKIYTLLSYHIAQQVYTQVSELQEVYVWLCSQIGKLIDQPLIASTHVILQPGIELSDIQSRIQAIILHKLATIGDFTHRLTRAGSTRSIIRLISRCSPSD